jgi:type IV pilus assembly protein PilC
MRILYDLLITTASLAVAVFLCGLVVVGLVATVGPMPAAMMVLVLMLAAGWMTYAYLRYRQARQDELLQVVTTAVEANLPLAPAIRAYLRDRPREGEGAIWDALLMLVLFPGFWLWRQRYAFDRRAAAVADLLDGGASLPAALVAVRGAAPREVKVAAAVGETTGRLAASLRRATRDRLAGAWLEIVPRLVYPLLLLLFIAGVTSFLMVVIMPKMQRIFRDFDEPLPAATQRLIDVWDRVIGWLSGVVQSATDAATAILPDFLAEDPDTGDLFVLLASIGIPTAVVLAAVILLAAVLIVSPAVRWYLPVFGRLYRWEVQGLVLRMLGALLDAGRPAPEALGVLAEAADLPGMARRRLRKARRVVERGEPLSAALRRANLLPATMAPLVQTSERTRTVPWALSELGELLSGRAVRVARRASLVVAPVLVIAVGVLVGFIVVGVFMPLIQLLTRLASET